jgi:hypothetical protein
MPYQHSGYHQGETGASGYPGNFYYGPTGHNPKDRRADPFATPAVKTGPRIGAIVCGALLVLIGLWLGAVSAGVVIDQQLGLIVVLAVAGFALIAAALIASLRRPKLPRTPVNGRPPGF